MDFTPILTWTRDYLGSPAKAYGEHVEAAYQAVVEQQLREALQQDWDLIIIGGQKWGTVPADCQQTLLDKVAAGTGLVYTYFRDGEDAPFLQTIAEAGSANSERVLHRVPWRGLPAWSGLTESSSPRWWGCASGGRAHRPAGLRAGELLLHLSRPGSGMVDGTLLFHQDYYLSLAMGAALWAADAGSSLALSDIYFRYEDGPSAFPLRSN